MNVDKPILYLCLVEVEDALVSRIMKELKALLPEDGPKSGQWARRFVATCLVANAEHWNLSFPQWRVTRS